MYRQSIAAENARMAEEKFIIRLGNLPMVHSAWNAGCGMYQKTKDSNALFRMSLNIAEGSVKTVANTAMPLVGKVQPQIDYVNSIAVQQLAKLEQRYPVITKPADQVISDSKEVCGNLVKPAVDRYNAVVSVGTDQVKRVKKIGIDGFNKVQNVGQGVLDKTLETSCGKFVANQVDTVLTFSENCVDKYLPEDQDETSKMEVDMVTKNPITRVSVISNKVRQRMYKQAMTDLKQVKVRSQDAINKLKFNVDLIEYARSSIDGAKTHAGQTWTKLTMEEDISDPKTLEDKSIVVARSLARQVRSSVTTLTSFAGNQSEFLNNQMKLAKQYADDIYQSFSKVNSYDEIPAWALTQTKDKLGYLTETLSFAADTLIMAPVKWMSLDFDVNDIQLEDPEIVNCNGVGVYRMDDGMASDMEA
ncbi:hypothetical protein SNE40_004540 [Patella caerulea]|uniref:Uncharacterized protein n=2 Tax=Patella caerulea TaxID=87958 RepID=A0AAN8K380_PATCE